MDNNSSRNPRDTGRKSSAASTVAKVLAVALIVILGGAAAYLGWFYKHLNRRSQQVIGSGFTGFITGHTPTVANQFPNQPDINLMIIGRDYDYNDKDQVIKSDARADLLMMARLDFAHNQVKILSIPRDTKAAIPGWPPSKINSAEEKGGPQLTEQTIMQNYNLPTDKYVALDFDGFQKAIDLLGGVDLTVDKKMDYDDNWGYLHIHLTPGYQHLDGNKAMGFVRFRHSDSDLIRTKRQQALLAALKIKIDQPQTFVILPDLINIMNNSAATDLTDNQKIAISYFLRGLKHSDIQMDTLPSVPGSYYVYTDWPKASLILQSWFGVTPPAPIFVADNSPTVAVRHRRHRAPQSL
jgi:polyisoprenyl-teichoic acid--peptidoglycan teichoic acid transferase